MAEAIRQYVDLGLSSVVSFGIIYFIITYMPQLIREWHKFTRAIDKNTEMTDRHFKETKNLKEELLEIKVRLEKHEEETRKISASKRSVVDTQAEILEILEEMHQMVKKGVKDIK